MSAFPREFKNLVPVDPTNANRYEVLDETGNPTGQYTHLRYAPGALQVPDPTAINKQWMQPIEDELAALTGACKIAIGSYAGTNAVGAANPNILTVGFAPKVLFVSNALIVSASEAYMTSTFAVIRNGPFVVADGQTRMTTINIHYNIATWSDQDIRWYNPNSDPGAQLNASGYTYYYAVFG